MGPVMAPHNNAMRAALGHVEFSFADACHDEPLALAPVLGTRVYPLLMLGLVIARPIEHKLMIRSAALRKLLGSHQIAGNK